MALVAGRKPLTQAYARSELALAATAEQENQVREAIREALASGATSLRLGEYEELTELPEEVGTLGKLYKLAVDNNYILRKIPPTISGLAEHLEELNLSYNALEALPDELCQLRYLRRLNCSNNRLTWVPTALDLLAVLEELCLDNNFITAFPPNVSYMKKLKKLFVSNNPLVDEDDTPHRPVHPPTVTECDLCKGPLPEVPLLVMNFTDLCQNKSIPIAYFLCGGRCERVVEELRDSEQTNYRILQYNLE